MSFKTNDEKSVLIKKYTPPSRVLFDCVRAFFIGGLICAAGQVIFIILSSPSLLAIEEDKAYTAVSYIFIFLASLLTGIGIFDRIGRFAGAGTLVPVTGFANSVVSQALDARGEGLVLGVGSKIFNVAGPVILYGMLSGNLYGFVLYAIELFKRIF